MKKNNEAELQVVANRLRQYVLAMAYYAGGAHISPAFSAMDILTVVYWYFLNISPENIHSSDRDRFILSKGHACTALYAILAELGFFEMSKLKTFCQSDSILGGHPDRNLIPGVEASTGSLAHGLSIALGMALGAKLQKKKYKVVTLVGDGECQEGTIWEAAMAASQLRLDNFTVIIDYNKLQGMGKTQEINDLESLSAKWESFGWAVQEIDGHSVIEIMNALDAIPFKCNKPNVIIAHTIKGKGISFMQDKAIWHYRLPDEDEMKIACKELGISDIKEVFL